MSEAAALPAISAGSATPVGAASASKFSPEIKLTMLLFFFAFFISGVPRTFTGTAAYSLFITAYGAKAVPYAYIGQAIAVPIAGFIFLQGEHRLSLKALLLATLATDIVVMILFRTGLAFQVPYTAAAAMMWLEIEFVLCSLLLWNLANAMMTLRQGKRLFGFIIAGEPVAIIICGLSTPLILRHLSLPDLFLFSAAGMAAGFLLVLYITANFKSPHEAHGHGHEEEEHAAPGAPKEKAWWKDKYIAVMISMIVCSQMIFFFMDETYYMAVEHHYPNEEAMGAFLGTFSAVVGAVSLVVSLFIAGPLVRRFGVRGGLLTLPVLLLIGTLSAVFIGNAMGVASTGLFIALAINKLMDQSFRYTLDKTTTVTLYAPLPADKRGKLQAALEAMIEPLTGGVAGVLLSLMLHVLHFTAIAMSAVMAVIVLGWLIFVIIESKGYGEVLRKAVAGRAFEFDPDAELSAEAIQSIRGGLTSRHVGEVLYAFQVLGTRQDGLTSEGVVPLLAHDEPQVRIASAEWLEEQQEHSALNQLEARLTAETDPRVRGALIAAIAGAAGDDAIETVTPFLDSGDAAEQIGAYQGLIRHGGIEGVIAAGNRLIADIQSADAERRQLAAEVMQKVGSHLFYRPLLRLLDDPNDDVRATALAAAGSIDAPQLRPAILRSLRSNRLTQPAIAAIGAIGDPMLEPLAVLYADDECPRATCKAAITAAGVIGTPAAAAWLMTLIEDEDRMLRHAALAALWRAEHHVSAADKPRVKAQMVREIETANWMLSAWSQIQGQGQSEGNALVARALADEVEETQETLFHLMGLIISSVDMHETMLRFVSGGATDRSYVLEMLDNLLDNDIKGSLLPFIEADSIEQRAAAAAKRAAERADLEGVATASQDMVGAWAPASALYALALIGSEAAEKAVAAARDMDDPVLQETAKWISLGSPAVGKDRDMLLTIEKVLIMRSVGIFANVRESSLTHAAQAIREVNVKTGDTVFAQGDFGDALYIIVSGKLKVHIGDKTLATLSERQVVGEMAALDPEPRSASVTAVEDSLLLKMSSDSLERLIGDDIRVARGIIQELCGRLRTANQAPAAKAAPEPEPA